MPSVLDLLLNYQARNEGGPAFGGAFQGGTLQGVPGVSGEATADYAAPQADAFVPPHMRLRGLLSGLMPDDAGEVAREAASAGPQFGTGTDAAVAKPSGGIVPRGILWDTLGIQPGGFLSPLASDAQKRQMTDPGEAAREAASAGPQMGLPQSSSDLVPTPVRTTTITPPAQSGVSDNTLMGMLSVPAGLNSMTTPPDISGGTGQGVTTKPVGEPLQITPSATGATTPTTDQTNVPETSLWGRLGGFGEGIRKGISDNSTTLLALAGGLAGAPNWGTGISRGLTAAVPASLIDTKQQANNQTAKFLMAKMPGLTAEQAIGIAGNPAILQHLLPQILGAKAYQHVVVKDAFGGETIKVFDPTKGTLSDPPGSTATPNQGAVKSIDSSLTGDDYLNQPGIPPEVRQAVKDYLAGRVSPTGNPRQGFTASVKMIASKYGNDIGIPADDTAFSARRQMRTALGMTTPASIGGQLNNGNTAMGHLADMSDAALKLENSGGWGFAPLATVINSVRGLSTEQAGKIQALQDAAQRYGQEITKFYAGSGGGEAERSAFMQKFNGAKSPTEMAAVLEAEAHLIPSKLAQIENQIKTTMGPMANEFPVLRPGTQEAIDKTHANIARLRGQTPAATETATSTPVPGGTYIYDARSGQMVRAR